MDIMKITLKNFSVDIELSEELKNANYFKTIDVLREVKDAIAKVEQELHKNYDKA